MKYLALAFIVIAPLLHIETSKPYDVHWFTGGATVERTDSRARNTVDVYCYRGSSKHLLNFFQSIKMKIGTKGDYQSYVGGSPEETYNKYVEDSYGWAVLPFQNRNPNVITLDPFNTTCLCVKTKESHRIELDIKRVDAWLLMMFSSGIALILVSKALSGNPVFFYLSGIFLGVFASFMVVVFYISKLFPKKPMMYGVMIGGWTVGVYLIQQIWDNMQSLILSYQTYLFWYTSFVGFFSFLICYRIGPPANERSRNIVMWTLQAIGSISVYYSSNYQEASASIVILCLLVKHFPRSLINRIVGYWYQRFPPKPKLLTNEEYYEQGARETLNALDSLRKYASSPDCAQWRIMLQLNDSKRFASFVEGDSHLSDEEVINYEAYAYSNAEDSSVNRSRHKMTTRRRNSRNVVPQLEISSDESEEDSEEIDS